VEFWGDEGAGLLVVAASTGRILVPLRSRYVMEPLTWGVHGGRIEPDEDPEEAAVREFVEETSYHGFVETFPAFTYEYEDDFEEVVFVFHNFIGVVPGEFKPQKNWETERFVWMTLPELVAVEPKHFGLQALLEDAESLALIQQFAR
jgi:8-oxo-dGTP pyrophosphatase MutT (NUDIX family)